MADELERWVPTGLLGGVDLLVVLPSRLSFVERTAECCRLLAPKVDLDLIAYTPKEFERMRERPSVAQALREGRGPALAAGAILALFGAEGLVRWYLGG